MLFGPKYFQHIKWETKADPKDLLIWKIRKSRKNEILKKINFLEKKFREKPQNRVFIEKYSYTAYSKGMCPKFSFIKKLNFFRNQNLVKKVHVFHRNCGFFHFFSIWYGADSKFTPISTAKFLAQKKKIRKNLKFFKNRLN